MIHGPQHIIGDREYGALLHHFNYVSNSDLPSPDYRELCRLMDQVKRDR